MKAIKQSGLYLFLIGLVIFTSLIFIGQYKITPAAFDQLVQSKGIKSELFINTMNSQVVGKTFDGTFGISSEIVNALETANETNKAAQKWDQVIWDKPASLAFELIKPASVGIVKEHTGLFFFLSFGLAIIGSLMYIIPNVVLLGAPGIKNNGIFQSHATNRGWIGILAFIYLVTFYVVLYFAPALLTNNISIVDPISRALSGNGASQWFLYGFLYCTVMTVMAIRMFIKYRHNKYQILRTACVLFFQIAFAFLIPEILVRFNMPWFDFKNAWPLNYTFFFDWNIKSLIAAGNIGVFMLVWGTLLTAIIIPILVYFYGKRWYCSWVCGCGGLAETLGDPYRQLSDKTVKSWKIERYLIHAVLVFAIVMTAGTLFTFFTEKRELFWGLTSDGIRTVYGFIIGAMFSGVIGTGFYPMMGNRVWCRFGCPLAAYMGIIQRF